MAVNTSDKYNILNNVKKKTIHIQYTIYINMQMRMQIGELWLLAQDNSLKQPFSPLECVMSAGFRSLFLLMLFSFFSLLDPCSALIWIEWKSIKFTNYVYIYQVKQSSNTIYRFATMNVLRHILIELTHPCHRQSSQ